MKKLTWMNGEYISRLPSETFRTLFTDRLAAAGLPEKPLHGTLETIQAEIQPRTKTLNDLPANCAYFFTEAYPFDPKAVEKRLKPEAAPAPFESIGHLLVNISTAFDALGDFSAASAEAALRAFGETHQIGIGALVHPVRVAVSGLTEGPGLFEMLAILGQKITVERLNTVAQRLADGNL